MPKMIASLAFALLLATSAGTASAAERVLLAPPATSAAAKSYGATLTAKETSQGTMAKLRATAARDGRVRVIVGYRVPFAAEASLSEKDRTQQQKEIAAAGASLRKKFSAAGKRGAGIRTFSSVPFATMEVTPNELNQLIADPAVLTIVEDQIVQPLTSNSVPQIGAPQAWAVGARGQGQTVAVIDKGAETNHPFLRDPATGKSKVVYEAGCNNGVCTVGNGRARIGSDGLVSHGTSVSGIIVGERPQSASTTPDAMTGVAPDARLMVFGTTTSGDALAALERIYQLRNQYKVASVNISLAWSYQNGGPVALDRNACYFYSPAVTAIIGNLREAGTATVVSAGNFAERTGATSMTEWLAYPACLSTAVSVGAVFADKKPVGTSYNSTCRTAQYIVKDQVLCYSNRSPDLTLLAPGYPIETSAVGGNYTIFDGTSAAAPHVAGAFAVLKSGAPNATVSQIVEALRITGKPVKDPRNNRITPRIDIGQALAYLQGGPKSVISYAATGEGSGAVNFSPVASRQSCQDDCTTTFAMGSSVTITAKPDPGMELLGWESPSGECKGKSLSCSFTTSRQVVPVTAKFGRIKGWASYMLVYYKTGMGYGTVTASANGRPLDCRTTICSATLPADTIVTLSAAPGSDRTMFVGWTGPCSGTAPSCSFPIKSASTVTAVFKEKPAFSLTVMKSGTGAITASVDGKSVDCSGQFCTLTGPAGAVVTLTAVPAKGNTFVNWSGLCTSATPDCKTTLQSSGLTTATFRISPGKLAATP